MKYDVCLKLVCTYQIEANSKEEAIQIADEYFAECVPEVICCEEVREDD